MRSPSLAIGVDVGGTTIAVARVTGDGGVGDMVTIPTPSQEGSAAVLASICRVVGDLLETACGGRIVGVGVGTGGIVDSDRGVVLASTDLIAGWAGTPIAQDLAGRLGLPVSVDNDGNALALAEARMGGAAPDALCVAVGTGIGGGLVLSGRVRRGRNHMAGEFGHLPANTGRRCSCGRVGHVEAVSSGPSMVQVYREMCGDRNVSDLRQVVAVAHSGDAVAGRVLSAGGAQLGRALAGVVISVDVDEVVVGGGVVGVGDRYLLPLTDALHAALPHGRRPPVVAARRGPEASVVGAGLLAFERHGFDVEVR